MNIYITKDNEERLRGLADWSMSGLINYLLNGYFEEGNLFAHKMHKGTHDTFKKLTKEIEGRDISDAEIDEAMNESFLGPESGKEWEGPIFRNKKKSKL